MNPILLIDFGSTYTKVTAVDLQQQRLLGTASAYTTVATDVGEGLADALTELEKQTGKLAFTKRLACSSAAGGLKMIACGLVPELTAKAAKLASLGAGAKIAALYSYELTEDDVEDIAAMNPDILLLTGGIDGGNSECILHNAELLAGGPGEYPIVVAGNRSCGRKIMRILEGRRAYLVENVMPALNTLNILSAQQKIREIFLEQIVKAKGLTREGKLLDDVLMPTPAAVLAAMELLANGTETQKGLGDLMAVDLGGATTDVYSIAIGEPKGANTIYKGLPEPYAKRTVEGDIGMRYSITGVVEAAGIARVARLAGMTVPAAEKLVDWVTHHTDALPDSNELKALDSAIAALAIETAAIRHAGTLEEVYTASGVAYAQTGKDLTDLDQVIFTGGALIHAENPPELAANALYHNKQPQSLRPKQAEVLIDKQYILAAMGLLAGYAPEAALNVMKKELVSHGYTQQKD